MECTCDCFSQHYICQLYYYVIPLFLEIMVIVYYRELNRLMVPFILCNSLITMLWMHLAGNSDNLVYFMLGSSFDSAAKGFRLKALEFALPIHDTVCGSRLQEWYMAKSINASPSCLINETCFPCWIAIDNYKAHLLTEDFDVILGLDIS